jgi:predicted ArsR family transcriptional regulator
MGQRTIDQQLTGLSGLGDPLRRALYRHVVERGYEPYDDPDGAIRLRNCPFDRIAAHHRQLVCGTNLAMLQGLADHLDADPPVRVVLDLQPGRCCVMLTRAS